MELTRPPIAFKRGWWRNILRDAMEKKVLVQGVKSVPKYSDREHHLRCNFYCQSFGLS